MSSTVSAAIAFGNHAGRRNRNQIHQTIAQPPMASGEKKTSISTKNDRILRSSVQLAKENVDSLIPASNNTPATQRYTLSDGSNKTRLAATIASRRNIPLRKPEKRYWRARSSH